MRNAAKRAVAQTKTSQTEMFGADVQVGPNEADPFFAAEKRAAEALLIDLTPVAPASVTYGEIWPRVLANHAVTRAAVNLMVARLRKAGTLIFHNWEPNKRVPDNSYRMSRAAQ